MPFIQLQSRQPEPRPESQPKGEKVNWLTGSPPPHVSPVQKYGEFIVETIPEPIRKPSPQPSYAPFAQGPGPSMAEEIRDDDDDYEEHPKPALRGPARGEKHGRSKLSKGEIQQIRLLAESNEWTISALARAYGCSRANIRRIIRGETWRDEMWCETR